MKKIIFLLSLLVLISCGRKSDIRVGDIIFTGQESGDVERAIASVTQSIDGYNFTHVGIVCKQDGVLSVLEATPPNVTITPLGEFLAAEDGVAKHWAVGRLKPQYRALIPAAIEYGRTLTGLGYDHAYKLGDDKYYCSELIYEILKKANNGQDVFDLNVMTFISPGTGETAAEWTGHFKALGVPVPEGEMGINPGAMSRSGVIDIISVSDN